jgi:hypothetical protein
MAITPFRQKTRFVFLLIEVTILCIGSWLMKMGVSQNILTELAIVPRQEFDARPLWRVRFSLLCKCALPLAEPQTERNHLTI